MCLLVVWSQVDMGVAQGDELQYIFSGLWGDDIEMSLSDMKFTRNILIPLLTNFAKTRYAKIKVFDGKNTLKSHFNMHAWLG